LIQGKNIAIECSKYRNFIWLLPVSGRSEIVNMVKQPMETQCIRYAFRPYMRWPPEACEVLGRHRIWNVRQSLSLTEGTRMSFRKTVTWGNNPHPNFWVVMWLDTIGSSYSRVWFSDSLKMRIKFITKGETARPKIGPNQTISGVIGLSKLQNIYHFIWDQRILKDRKVWVKYLQAFTKTFWTS